MYKTLSCLSLVILVGFIFSCSESDNDNQNPTENQVMMFPGIVTGSITLASGSDNLIHIRGNSVTNTLDFIKIDAEGNQDIIDITSEFLQLGEFLVAPIFYSYNNQIVIIGQIGSSSNMQISYITFDYDGDFINAETLVQNSSFFYEYNLTEEGFIMYSEEFNPQQGNFIDYKRFSLAGNLINEGVIEINDDYIGVEDASVENGEIYISGKNNFISNEEGFQRQFCAIFSANEELVDILSWDQNNNIDNLSNVRVNNNRIHRIYEGNSNAIIDVFDLQGALITTKSYDGLYINNSFAYSQNKFLIASLNNSANKEFDFQVFDANLSTELYFSNYGALNSVDGTTDLALISKIMESENFYTIVGQTDATRSGDFDLPENTGSFDTYIIRFRKN